MVNRSALATRLPPHTTTADFQAFVRERLLLELSAVLAVYFPAADPAHDGAGWVATDGAIRFTDGAGHAVTITIHPD